MFTGIWPVGSEKHQVGIPDRPAPDRKPQIITGKEGYPPTNIIDDDLLVPVAKEQIFPAHREQMFLVVVEYFAGWRNKKKTVVKMIFLFIN